MLAITVNTDGNVMTYGYYTIEGITAENFVENINQTDEGMSGEILAVINEDNPMFSKVHDFSMFEPIYNIKGKLIDVKEIVIESDVLIDEINQLKTFLSNTDYQVIKNIEVFISQMAESYNIELPYNPVELHEERQAWRDEIGTRTIKLEELSDVE